MVTLSAGRYYLRALEPEDLEVLYALENDEGAWQFSNTIAPFSRQILREYLKNAHKDIFEARQLRLAICAKNRVEALGFIDLFDYEPLHRRAGVGIIVKDASLRGTGIGSEALGMIVDYAFSRLQLHQLYANIDPANHASVALFTKFGFEMTGLKKEWNFIHGAFRDEAIYQLINLNKPLREF